jgi:catecholate siderophore receptor
MSTRLMLLPSLMMAGALPSHGAQDAAATAKKSEQLADVVVEEQAAPSVASPKITTALRDTPQTITVINKEVFQQQGATTLRDVLRNTPGITFQAGEGGTPAGDQMTIRGFSARTDMFIDGIRDTAGYARDAFNLEQVEVTKGPGSANSGRGSTGGSINLVSKTPQATSFQTGTAGVGTDDYLRATLDINEQIATSPAPGTALRLNAMWQNSDVAGRDVVENKSWAVAPSLALGLGRPTRLTLSYVHMDQDNVPDYGIPWVPAAHVPLAAYANQAAPVDFSNFYGLRRRDYEKIQNDVATAQIDAELGDALSLRNTTRFGRTRRDSIITAPRFVSNTSTDIRRNDWKSRDQEDSIVANNTNLSATLSTGAITHDIAAGVELAREDSVNYTRVATGPQSANTDVYRPNPDDAYTEAIARNGAYTDAEAKAAGIYLFDTVKLNPQWQLNGGVRWDRFEVDYASVPAAGAATVFDRTDEMTSWKAGVVYKPRENGSVYAGYGTSFNPSAEGLSLTAATEALEPEKSRTYEIGTKWDLLDRGLSLSAALFRTEKTNARTPGVNAGDPPTVLQGEQRVEGFEVGVSGNLTRRWSGFAGYAYMKSKIIASNTATEVNNDLGLTPEHSLNLWTSYELARGVSVGLGAQYLDSVFRNATNTASVPSYWLYNAMAAYEVNKQLTLRLNVYNLADEEYVDRVGGGHFIPGPGRSATLTANFQF